MGCCAYRTPSVGADRFHYREGFDRQVFFEEGEVVEEPIVDYGASSLMDLSSICGLPLAFLMIREADDGDDDWCILRTGVIRTGDGFALDLGPGRAPVPVPDGLERQIKTTPESLLELLDGAEYYIPFVVEDLASGEANDFVVSLGLRWPGSEEAS